MTPACRRRWRGSGRGKRRSPIRGTELFAESDPSDGRGAQATPPEGRRCEQRERNRAGVADRQPGLEVPAGLNGEEAGTVPAFPGAGEGGLGGEQRAAPRAAVCGIISHTKKGRGVIMRPGSGGGESEGSPKRSQESLFHVKFLYREDLLQLVPLVRPVQSDTLPEEDPEREDDEGAHGRGGNDDAKNHPSHAAPAITFAAVPPLIDSPRRVFCRMEDSMIQTPPPKAGKRSTALMRYTTVSRSGTALNSLDHAWKASRNTSSRSCPFGRSSPRSCWVAEGAFDHEGDGTGFLFFREPPLGPGVRTLVPCECTIWCRA
jgi:hypothetical protein